MNKRFKPIDGPFNWFVTRKISFIFTRISLKTGITPNMLTMASFIVSIGASIVLFLNLQSIAWFIFAAVCVELAAAFDASDGEVARSLGTGTYFGVWLDSFTDRVKEFLYFTAAGIYVIRNNYISFEWAMVLMFTAVFTNFMSGYITDTKKHILKKRRKRDIVFGRRFSLGMVENRDFVLIAGFILEIFKIKGILYVLYIFAGILLPIIGLQFYIAARQLRRMDKKDKRSREKVSRLKK